MVSINIPQNGRLTAFVVLSLWAVSMPPASAFSAEATSDLTGAQLRRLNNGEVIVAVKPQDGPAKGMVEAAILIEAPAEKIWQVMVDCDEAPTFVPGLKACKVLDSGQNWDIIRHDVKWVWLFPRISYVFRADYQKHSRIDFIRTEGDLRAMKGIWRLSPLNGDRTIVRYSVFLDPGFFVPQWLVRRSLKADLPDVLTALRNEVLTGPGETRP